jgi:hypothetical protein
MRLEFCMQAPNKALQSDAPRFAGRAAERRRWTS